MGFADWWIPRVCRLCSREIDSDIDLCAHCEQSLAWNRHPCPQCGLPKPAGTPRPADPQEACIQCLHDPPPFSATLAPLLYEGAVRKWVRRAKSARGIGEATLLSGLLGRGVDRAETQIPEGLVPVPLTTGRLFRRGHNQAILLAAPLARRYRIAVHRRGIRRIGGGKPQRGQSRGARARSVRGVFLATRPFAGHLAIVDDVMTTGATVTELAWALLAAGATRVDVWAVARVPPTPEEKGVVPDQQAGSGYLDS